MQATTQTTQTTITTQTTTTQTTMQAEMQATTQTAQTTITTTQARTHLEKTLTAQTADAKNNKKIAPRVQSFCMIGTNSLLLTV